MDAFYRPTWVEISLDALRSNIEGFQKILPAGMKQMAVVKADAYGHGAVEVSKEALAAGVDYLGVAFFDEALELRNAGITAPILVLGYTPPEGVERARELDVTIAVYSRDVLEELQAQQHRKKLKIHIKLDTGMGRLGLHTEADAIPFIEQALTIPNVEVEGLFTHYANADEVDKSYTLEQYRRFERIVSYFTDKGVSFPYIHAGNSAAAIDLPGLTYSMVRLGISMYGLYPSADVDQAKIDLKPVLSLKTGIVHLKTLPPGSGISYGTIYHTKGEERIGTLPIGYADGYSRMLSGKAEVLVRGKRVPIVGRICMDQCMINVSEVEDVKALDEVVLIGEQDGQCIRAEDIADQLGTVNYEVICMISHRVARVYVRGGERVDAINPLMRHRY
ncbi:alanine racemase [Paenibacillus sp. GCM10023248]|uniref:alanine racemase n=1 Tax=Bacillales TaxID=1385 RepID=UPI0023781BE3|nr:MULTISPECIES: alanine racemase [Bacillales]MDD9266595.1 alanine racemase [Paenibacillus sp. MAHUQ-63]MDR6878724.1 alanine racemase [Bacillus sp. 3255]